MVPTGLFEINGPAALYPGSTRALLILEASRFREVEGRA